MATHPLPNVNLQDDNLDIPDKLATSHLDHINETVEDCDNAPVYRSPYDDMGVVKTLVTFKRAVLYTFLIATVTMTEGFEIIITSSIIVNAGFNLQFGTALTAEGFPRVEAKWVSAWGAVVNVGQIMSMLWVSFIADRFGRKIALLLSWLLLAISLAISNAATTPAAWLAARLFTGMGLGVMQVLIIPYKIELVPTRIRGLITVFGSIWSAVGGIVCSTMMQQLNKRHPLDWKLPIYIAWAPITLASVCIIAVPESPWHWARRGDKVKAVTSLQKLNGGIEGYDIENEYRIIMKTIEQERKDLAANNATRWNDFLSGVNKRRALTALLMTISGQLGGLTLVNSYNTYFFSFVNLPDPFLGTVIITCIGLASLLVFACVTDRFGRRIIVAGAFTLMCVSLWLIGGLYYVQTQAGGIAVLVVACVWQAAFVINGSAFYLFAAELPSMNLRVKTGSINFVIQALLGLTTNFVVPFMLESLNIRAGFVFGALSVPVAVLIWIYLPETRGRSIAEINELFERRIPAWRWDQTITHCRQERTEL